MNIKVHDVISDLTGVSGLKMIRAIGEIRAYGLYSLLSPAPASQKCKLLFALGR